MRHLWEVEHSYYCTEDGYYQSGCKTYESWDDFIAEEGDADMDFNLLFRWDWSWPTDKEGENKEFRDDSNYRECELRLYWVGQRRGLFRPTKVMVCRNDENEVREWLLPRMRHLFDLWKPLTSDLSKA